MINYVIIPVKNKSERLPDKDLILMGHTVRWLANELYRIKDETCVAVYGYLDDDNMLRMLSIIPPWVQYMPLSKDEDIGHIQATRAVIDKLGVRKEDNIAMLQLTQPDRRVGLLHDCLMTVSTIRHRSVLSASRVIVDGRLIDYKGHIDDNQADAIMLYDGAVYGGTLDTWSNWFTLDADSSMIVNKDIRVCDIDTYGDFTRCAKFNI